MSEGVRCMRSANIISLYFIASQCVMDRYCSYSATGSLGNICSSTKMGHFVDAIQETAMPSMFSLHIVDGAGREWMAPECM